MRRRLFNILAAVSLVLCVATVVLWGRSYWTIDTISWQSLENGSIFFIRSCRGGVQSSYVCNDYVSESIEPDVFYLYQEDAALAVIWLDEGNAGSGFGFTELDDISWVAWIPHWMFVLITALLPGYWAISLMRKMHNVRFDHCRTCGYNLTGNVRGTCPECGTAIPAPINTPEP